MREAKIVVCTRPWASTAGPPELPWRTVPRSVVTERRTGAPVRVVDEHVARLTDPTGRGGERAVLRVAEDRHRPSLDRVDQTERRRPEPADAKHGDVVARIEGDDVGVAELSVVVVDARVLHPGHDVSVRDDEVRRGDPAGAFDPEPARRPDDAEDARARQADTRTVEQGRVGRADARHRSENRRERVDARDCVEQPRRRHARVQLPEDPRALHLLAKLHLARNVERHRAGDPHDRRPRDSAEHEPADRVERAQRRQDEEARANRIPGHRRDALQEEAERDRSAERDERRVRRLAPGEELRRELRAEVRTGDDPGEREGASDETSPQPVQRREADHGRRDPVDRGHATTLLSDPATLSVALGGVVQLVRTPACHAGGRGFESRRSRLSKSL